MQAEKEDLRLTPPSDAVLQELQNAAPWIRYSSVSVTQAALICETYEALIADYTRLRTAENQRAAVIPFRPVLLDCERTPDDLGGAA